MPEPVESAPRTVGLSTACPAPAADRIGGRGQLEVEANFSTTQYVIWICRDTVADNLWYHASTKGQDVGGRITLPAVRTGDGYEARNGQSVYRITSDRITLTTPTGKLMIDQKVSIS